MCNAVRDARGGLLVSAIKCREECCRFGSPLPQSDQSPHLLFGDQAQTHQISSGHFVSEFFNQVLEIAFAIAKGAAAQFAGYS